MCLGVPGRVVAIEDKATLLGVVEFSGVRRKVNMACVAGPEELDAMVGAWVLVHVGFAMSLIDEAEAKKTLEVLEELGEAMAEMEAMREADAMLAEVEQGLAETEQGR